MKPKIYPLLKKVHLFRFFLIITLVTNLNYQMISQNPCGFDQLLEVLIENQNGNYPTGPQGCLEVNEYQITDIQIPVIFHLLYNDEFGNNIEYSSIKNLVNEINDYLQPEEVDGFTVNLSFYLANTNSCTPGFEKIYNENPTINASDHQMVLSEDGRIKASNTWPEEFYCNIYLVESILWPSGQVEAYSNLPSDNFLPLIEGIVISIDGLDKLTFIHEFGHYSDLYHVWNKRSDCLENDDCRNGDFIDDTPAVAGTWFSDLISPEVNPENPLLKDCDAWENGFCEEFDYFQTPLGIFLNPLCFPDYCPSSTLEFWQYPVDNFMSYGFNCMYRFTDQQYGRMVHYLNDYKLDMITGNIPDVDLSSNTDHSINELLAIVNVSSLEELCNSNEEFIITLGGNLIIDSGPNNPVCFKNGTRINMLEGASITIKNNSILNLDNVFIQGCERFWQHIYVEDGSTLRAENNTKIENGLNAIRAEKNATVILSNCTFTNNRVGLYLGSEGSGWYTKLVMSNCSFNSNEYYNYLLLDIMYGRPEAGIKVNNQLYVNLGPVDGSRNSFSRLSNGIRAENSIIRVINSDFYDIYTGGLPEHHGSIFYRNGYGVFVSEGIAPIIIENNSFENVRYAIGIRKGRTVIGSNIIKNVEQGVLLFNTDNISIFNNQIEAFERGIYLSFSQQFESSLAAFNIESNYITIVGNSASAKSIEIDQSHNSFIENNYITINDNAAGIYLSSSNTHNIKNNTIKINRTNSNLTNCIYLEGSLFNIFESNDLYDHPESPINKGLYANNSAQNNYLCNYFNNFNHGMQFWDNCDHSIMKGNTFYANQNDLVLGDINNIGTPDGATWTGPQGNLENLEGNGNKWPFYSSKAHNSATEPIVGWSPFYVNAHVDPDYQPDVISSAGQWFYNQTNITNLSPCSGNPGSDLPPPCSELISKIMLVDTMSGVEPCKKLMWQYKYYQQLIKMKKEGQLSAKCLQFLNAQQNNVLVKIAEIQEGVDSIGILSQGSADALNEVFELSMTLDSLRAAEQTGTPLWEQTMTEYGHAISIYEAIRKMDTQQDSIRTIDLHSKIGRVTVSDSCLAVLLKVFGVKLRLLQQDKLDQRDLSDLSVIAASCPDDLGEGVFIARSMMSLYENPRYPRMEDCVDGRGVTPRNISDEVVTEEKLRVYPNPANDEVTIQISTKKGESGRLSIMNAQGRMIETFETDERSAIIRVNTSQWANGIYFIEYNNATGDGNELQKLMIVK